MFSSLYLFSGYLNQKPSLFLTNSLAKYNFRNINVLDNVESYITHYRGVMFIRNCVYYR